MFDRKLLGEALRRLRTEAGLTQAEAARRSGLSQSVLNRAETGSSYLSLESLEAVLRALNVDLRDLGHAVDLVTGRAPSPSAGRPRATWVEGLRQRGVDRDVLFGFAYGAIEGDDPQAEADLVASAEEAARLLAAAVLEERRAFELERAREVGDPRPSHGDTAPSRRARPRGD